MPISDSKMSNHDHSKTFKLPRQRLSPMARDQGWAVMRVDDASRA